MAGLTTTQAGKRLGVSRPTVHALIKRGELKAYRIGRDYRIEEGELTRFRQRGGTPQQGKQQ